MIKSPWFTLVLGLLVGLAIGYVLGESQPVPPARAMAQAEMVSEGAGGTPEGHPPMGGDAGAPGVGFDQRRREIERLLQQSPEDARLLAAMGNLHFDANQWPEARSWYERSLERAPDDAHVITDLAVVFRNLKQPEPALELLDRAIRIAPDQWQAWYNKVVVLQFDLHRHDEAAAALERLREIQAGNPGEVPDLTALEQQILGHEG